MNPNTETLVEAPQPTALVSKPHTNLPALVTFLTAGFVVLIWLIIRTDLRISAIKRDFSQRRRDIARQCSMDLFELHTQQQRQTAQTAINSQLQDTTSLSVPVTPNDVRDRRKIVRLY